MTAPYFARSIGLFGAPGSPAPPRTQVDLSGAIGAIGNSTAGIIRAAMQRKLQENELTAGGQQAYASLQRESPDDPLAKSAFDPQLVHQYQGALDSARQARRDQMQGWVPSSTSTTMQPAQVPLTPLNPASLPTPPSPVHQAMAQNSLPPVSVTPSAPAPITGSATIFRPETTSTPAHYDPTKNLATERALMLQDMRNQGFMTRAEFQADHADQRQRERLDAQQRGREFAASAAKDLATQRTDAQARLAQWKQAHPNQRTGVDADGFTPAQRQARNERVAAGFLGQYGSLDNALDDFRNTDEGKALAQQGVSETDLLAASRTMKADPATGRLISLVNSGAAPDVASAATIEQNAEATARANRKPARLTAPGKPPASGNIDLRSNQQRTDYDAAAAHLRKQGKTDTEILRTIGQRP